MHYVFLDDVRLLTTAYGVLKPAENPRGSHADACLTTAYGVLKPGAETLF